MRTVRYDGSYQGWLTAVFDIYQNRFADVCFLGDSPGSVSMFGTPYDVVTDETKANRVIKGLEQKLTPEGVEALYKTFLSEVEKADDIMLRFVRYAFSSNENIERDLVNPVVGEVMRSAKIVRREAHRMTAFVRFKKTSDDLYYAVIEPDCNVLPLIVKHFKDRFTDQRWVIYDARRKYGIYYDLHTVTTVSLEFTAAPSSTAITAIFDEREELFQNLWRRYFASVNIEARKNIKLHLQHMPKRYWRHLTEKTGA